MEEAQRILLVDDDPVTLMLLRHVLEQAYFDVFSAASGEDALNLIKLKRIPHLAIVDINMPPGMDGFTFCKEAHKRVPGLPVIMLTSVGDEATIVKAFDEFQAEDYVVKPEDGPIRADELVSRVRRVLRNQPDYSYALESVAAVDERLSVDVGNRKVFIGGEEITLTPTENKLLAILMRHPGRTLANDYLLRQIWPMEYANEERLHTHVYRLRKKIEVDPKEPTYVVSDWGRGYNFPAVDVS